MTNSTTNRPRRRFSKEFQLAAVELLRSSGMTVAQVSAELGVSSVALYRWSNESLDAASTDAWQENKELKRELRQVRRELEF